MIIGREINVEAARRLGLEAFMELTVNTREEARTVARRWLPAALGTQVVIYIREENLVAYLGGLEDAQEVRCWTPIADGKAVIFPQGPVCCSGEHLRLGYPKDQGEAPFLFPNGREKEKRNEDTEVRGEK